MFWNVKLSLSAPAAAPEMSPTKTPNVKLAVVPIVSWMMQFLIVMFVEPLPVPRLAMKKFPVPAAVLFWMKLRLRSVPVPPIEPSIVTRSAPRIGIKVPPVPVPVTERAAPVG